MDIHFFMDPLGYYSSKFAERAFTITPGCRIININVPKSLHEKIDYYDGFTKELKEEVLKLKVDRVYFHFYNATFEYVNKLIKSKNPACKSYWFFWSGEFYNLPELSHLQYLDFSTAYINRTKFKHYWLKNAAKYVLKSLYDKTIYLKSSFFKSFQLIDYFVCTFKEEYMNVKEYAKCSFEYKHFAYLSTDQTLGDLKDQDFLNDGKTIMIGHSSNPCLNHYEIIVKLNEIKCNSNILLPLSYGDLDYKDYLLDHIRGFKLNIERMEEFVDLDSYNRKLSAVTFAVFNSPIQIAFGNVISLLWMGVKIFFHEKSSLYIELKRMGMIVFSTEQITYDEITSPFSREQKLLNREKLEEYLSENKVLEYYKKILL